MEEAVIVGGARTPVGTYGKAFRDVPAKDLGAVAIRAALERTGVDPAQVDDVILGCVGQVGEDAYIARVSSLRAGIPEEVPAVTVNRVCGSGVESVNRASDAVRLGSAQIVVAGGTESMSSGPFLVRKGRWGYRLGHGALQDNVVLNVTCPINDYHMGVTAENVAERYGISRQAQDEFAYRSNMRAVTAMKEGRFKDEIAPVPVPPYGERGRIIYDDEHPQPDISMERLAAGPPAFREGGTVTAGNTTGINDGAAAMIVMSLSKARELGLEPWLKPLGHAVAGVDPAYMGIGPSKAIPKVLRQVGLSLSDIDLIELNEPFAATAIAVGEDLGLDWSKVNVNGGAVALGHPIGATGAILTIKLMYEMKRRGARYGLVSLCIGGGQGIATVFENLLR